MEQAISGPWMSPNASLIGRDFMFGFGAIARFPLQPALREL
jgi:hypothetical protein